jgi:hypothetical protein
MIWAELLGGSTVMWRAVAAGVSVVVAGAGGVVTALVTAHPSAGLWVALSVLLVVGGILQVVVSAGDRRSSRAVTASGAGAVAVGGSAGTIRTRVHGEHGPAGKPDGDGVAAAGPGSVAVGGDAAGPVSTEITGPGTGSGS